MFKKNYTGVEDNKPQIYNPIPDGDYQLVIIKAEEGRPTQKGDPTVDVTTKVASGDYKGRLIWHRVCFITGNGAGISKHWLKVIGMPFEGEVEVEPSDWVDKTFTGTVATEQYIAKDGSEKEKNVITNVETDEDSF